jgi:hypothetical protein
MGDAMNGRAIDGHGLWRQQELRVSGAL